ncbi:MAG: lytic transglycosylase domain-containing protein [Bacteroidota bacterium]
MKTPQLIFFLLLATFTTLRSAPFYYPLEAEVDRIISVSDEEVRKRLAQLDASIVEYRFDPSVRRLIRMYVENWRQGSERLLGRTLRYFPYFSQALAEKNMPDAIKYLSITESALRPFAISHAGAGGLWQLMPETARELGLEVSDRIDERFDLVAGTDAGLRYLQIQYDRFGDWALAMAAYNSGPGRVIRAKRRSGSDNYWKLRRYLPRETRSYVPGFIAATYLCTFYRSHDLFAQPVDLDLQVTGLVPVYREISLHRVAMVTGLKPDRVVELNPAYLRGYLPAREEGRLLRLPQRVIPAMQSYLNEEYDREQDIAIPWLSPLLNNGEKHSEKYYQAYQTLPSPTDTSHRYMAQLLGIAPDHLLVWSGYGELDTLRADQWWTYYRINEYLKYGPPPREIPPPVPPLGTKTAQSQWQVKSGITGLKVVKPLELHEPNSPKRSRGIKAIVDDIWEWIKE